MADLPLYEYLHQQIKDKFKPGDSFTADDVEADRSSRHSRQNALWLLYKKGYLDKPRGKGSRGRYVLRGRKAPETANGRTKTRPRKVAKPRPVVQATPVQAIYDLLDFMAAAEPALKRAAKILEAVDNA